MSVMSGNLVWDVIVVGGGPAGMMAAGRAAERGLKVILAEKNGSFGTKLLLTGGGRCNFTNSEFDIRKFTEKYGDAGKFLFSAFSRMGVRETLDFFHKRGMSTKTENDLRTFPVTDSAETVLDVLIDYMKEGGVVTLLNSPVEEIIREKEVFSGVKLNNGDVIRGRNIIIATGGTSWPETGSTGDGYLWLKDIGHAVIEPSPALVPIMVRDRWVKELSGISLDEVRINVFSGGKKKLSVEGSILFTHTGISGPTIINMSGKIGKLLKEGEVTVSLDMSGSEDDRSADIKIRELFKKNNNKKLRNAIANIVPAAMAPIIIRMAGIDMEAECNIVTREERLRLVDLLRKMPIRVSGLGSAERSIVAGGGVIPEEIDFKTMRSRLVPNIHIVGDVPDIDRPSGGYSLQLCWTTGYIAGDSVSAHTDI
jgi:hypothetical protein